MKVDMSPKAISTRLKRVAQLRRLCLSLGRAKSVPKKGEELRAGETGFKGKS